MNQSLSRYAHECLMSKMIIDVKLMNHNWNAIVAYHKKSGKAWYVSCVCCVSSCLCVVNHYHLQSFAIDATFSASKNGCREHLKHFKWKIIWQTLPIK